MLVPLLIVALAAAGWAAPTVRAPARAGTAAGLALRPHPGLARRQPLPDRRSGSAPAQLAEGARANIQRQLSAMAGVVGDAEDPILKAVARDADWLVSEIRSKLEAGEIDPGAAIRLSPEGAPAAPSPRPARIGVYPVAADPFHWGHLLIGLQAVGTLGLDKVVYVPAGDDPRKPNMTKASLRHPMARAALAGFSPFFDFSPIASGGNRDGETNLFHLLGLNRDRPVEATYLVGADHYRARDAKGNPDTLPKLEANRSDPALAFDAALHRIRVAFIDRGERGPEVPTALPVDFLPTLPFDASSTQVRQGRLSLMPYDAWRFVRDNKLGLYGIPAD